MNAAGVYKVETSPDAECMDVASMALTIKLSRVLASFLADQNKFFYCPSLWKAKT